MLLRKDQCSQKKSEVSKVSDRISDIRKESAVGKKERSLLAKRPYPRLKPTPRWLSAGSASRTLFLDIIKLFPLIALHNPYGVLTKFGVAEIDDHSSFTKLFGSDQVAI